MADDQYLTVEQLQAELRALQERHAATLAENALLYANAPARGCDERRVAVDRPRADGRPSRCSMAWSRRRSV